MLIFQTLNGNARNSFQTIVSDVGNAIFSGSVYLSVIDQVAPFPTAVVEFQKRGCILLDAAQDTKLWAVSDCH